MYYIEIKDNIAIGISRLMPELSFMCDSIEEVDDNIALTMELPCKKINGEWVHTDEFPKIEYPESEPVDPEPQPPTLEDRVADLEAENETISEVLDALLMGDIEV